jgi:hypothetical protein
MRLEIRDTRHRDEPALVGWLVGQPGGFPVTLEAALPAVDDPLYDHGGWEGWREEAAQCHLARLRNFVRWGGMPAPGPLRGHLDAAEVPEGGDYPAALREVWRPAARQPRVPGPVIYAPEEGDPPAPDVVVPGQDRAPRECFTTGATVAGPLDPAEARGELERLWAERRQALLGDARALPPDRDAGAAP